MCSREVVLSLRPKNEECINVDMRMENMCEHTWITVPQY